MKRPLRPIEILSAEYNAKSAVYFIQYGEDGLIKIGFSSDVYRRMASIQRECPLRIRLLGWRIGGRTEENRLHHQFASSRAHGEWFFPTAELLTYVDTSTERGDPPVNPYPQAAFDAARRMRSA